MRTTALSPEEAARRGDELYEHKIPSVVELAENIGKMVIIDVETGDFEIDERGIAASRILQSRYPHAALHGMRIGYNVAESIGGTMERTAP